MREIKFRGKKICSSEWASGYYYWNDCDNKPYIMIDCHEEHEFEFESVGQFTGLKDKSNREMFEGDLVKFSDKVFEIKWSRLLARFIGKTVDNEFDLFACYQDLYEVIGNKFDNPELLEGEK